MPQYHLGRYKHSDSLRSQVRALGPHGPKMGARGLVFSTWATFPKVYPGTMADGRINIVCLIVG